MSVFDGLKFRKVYSPIHVLDPRIKFVYVCAIFVIAIIFSELLPLIVLFLMQIPFVLLAGVKREWLRSLRGAAFLATIIFLTNFLVAYVGAGYVITPKNLENALAFNTALYCVGRVFLCFLFDDITRPFGFGFGADACSIRVYLCFYNRCAFCSSSSRRSTDNNGRSKSQRFRA